MIQYTIINQPKVWERPAKKVSWHERFKAFLKRFI
jgi:hypothetical protein